MTYIVGTQISFKKKEDTPERSKLYIPGTKILFVNWIPSLQTLTIAPAY